jgi:hypothetical protein
MSERVGRNDPCPCGSGKKYKRCCLATDPPRSLPTPDPWPSSASPDRSPATPDGANARSFPGPPPRPRDEWDDWYDRYGDCGFAEKLAMLRTLLAEDHPPAFYTDIEFVSVVLEAGEDPDIEDRGAYIAFLEEMFASRADVFQLGADWFVREMAYVYVCGGRDHEIARLLPPLLGRDHQPGEAAFDLADLLRLADLYEESRRLTFAMLEQARNGQYMPWAIEELIEFAAFFLYGDAIERGCVPEALDQLREELDRIGCHPPEDALSAMVAHRAGAAGRDFRLEELLGSKEPASFNRYLLSLDFGRWLARDRQIPPLVADTFGCFVHWALCEMSEKRDRDPLTLRQRRFDEYLTRLLRSLSLQRLRAVATLVGMRHFYDFLASVSLINEREQERARAICDDLWSQVQQVLGDTAAEYAVLDRYPH